MRVRLIIIYQLVFASAYAQLMNEDIYTDIKSISLEVAKSCETKGCYIVGIGRSPAPFIEFLKQAEFLTLNLPLSQFRNTLSAASREVFYSHFDKYLSDIIKNKSRELVLVDFSGTGESLGVSKKYIEMWAKSRGLKLKIKATSITKNYNKKIVNSIKKVIGGKVIKISDEQLDLNLSSEKYKSISQYPQYNGRYLVEENKSYIKLQKLIAQWIKKDVNFNKFKRELNEISNPPNLSAQSRVQKLSNCVHSILDYLN